MQNLCNNRVFALSRLEEQQIGEAVISEVKKDENEESNIEVEDENAEAIEGYHRAVLVPKEMKVVGYSCLPQFPNCKRIFSEVKKLYEHLQQVHNYKFHCEFHECPLIFESM